MSTYLSEVKSQFDQDIQHLAQDLWDKLVEPALKQSFKNGLEVGGSRRRSRTGDASRREFPAGDRAESR